MKRHAFYVRVTCLNRIKKYDKTFFVFLLSHKNKRNLKSFLFSPFHQEVWTVSVDEVPTASQGHVCRLKPSLPAFCCAHSVAWRRRQYGNHSALMHFSGPTWPTVSRGSRSPEIGLMRITSVRRSLERNRERKREG